jgi:NAD(P) transhydrogenase subunit alpha
MCRRAKERRCYICRHRDGPARHAGTSIHPHHKSSLSVRSGSCAGIAMTIDGFVALYIFMLAAFAGWVIIGRVPAILHTPLMSGSNFVHGIVVIGGLYALLNASTGLVLLGAGNAAGGYAVTDRMLAMFQTSAHPPAHAAHKAAAHRRKAASPKHG